MKRLLMATLLFLSPLVGAQTLWHAPIAVVVSAPPVITPSALFDKAPVLTTWNENEKSIPIYYLETHKFAAPTRDAFAIGLASRLKELTAQSGFENCAAICVAHHNPRSWAAVVTTVKSQSMCLVVDVCPEGYKLSNADIHSHIHQSLYKPNAVDRLLLAPEFKNRELVVTVPDEFSEEDYMRTGYMVSERFVWFQSGKSQVRKIATLPNLSVPAATP